MSQILPFLTAAIFGLCSALIALAGVYVRFDLGAVFAYLRARRVAKNLLAQEGQTPAWQAAQAEAVRLADLAAFPEDVVKMWPLAVLVGGLAFVIVLRLFQKKMAGEVRNDIKERMIMRLAYRTGGSALEDLKNAPMPLEEAQSVLAHLCEQGQLREEAGRYVLVKNN